ncbi:MAG: TlyA family RNA methyltransferase [Holosporales bacterium]
MSRLDEHLLALGLASTPEAANALIVRGMVLVDDRPVTKAGTKVPKNAVVRLKSGAGERAWVSRGAYKLLKGLEVFAPKVAGAVCLDVGASTGGFTEVLLHAGAVRVYAVDVGYGQLAWTLRQDARVVVLDRCNARHLTAQNILEPLDAVVCDASFIALAKVLEVPLGFVRPGGWLVALVKPQFEVAPEFVEKGGIVRDAAAQQAAVDNVSAWLQARSGWRVQGVAESPITGAEGNKEFLLYGSFSV